MTTFDTAASSPVPPPAALTRARAAIAAACARAGRDPGAVALMAVSKTRTAEEIRPLLAAGQRLFGENRVQEAQTKWPTLKETCPETDLHLIGPLQTNKVKEAVALFDAIDSVDRPRLAEALAAEMARRNRRLPVLIQVNTGEEPQKAGVAPLDADGLITLCREDLGLDVRGLMCVPPVADNPAPHFALLRDIARRHGLTTLSMGMSDDFETAVAFGATHIRLGTALFGARLPTGPGA